MLAPSWFALGGKVALDSPLICLVLFPISLPLRKFPPVGNSPHLPRNHLPRKTRLTKRRTNSLPLDLSLFLGASLRATCAAKPEPGQLNCARRWTHSVPSEPVAPPSACLRSFFATVDRFGFYFMSETGNGFLRPGHVSRDAEEAFNAGEGGSPSKGFWAAA